MSDDVAMTPETPQSTGEPVTPEAPASTSEPVTPETRPELPECARLRKPTPARRLKTWLSSPPWWVQSVLAAFVVGSIVAAASILWQERISDRQAKQAQSISADQARQATRLENLRFVRQLSSESGVVARPFSGFDLQGQSLAGLDLRGAQFDKANLQDAKLYYSDLRPTASGTPTTLFAANLTGANLTGAHLNDAILSGAHLNNATLSGAYLTDAKLNFARLNGANLNGANLTGANLDHTNLDGVHYDEKTKWPVGFKPPPSA